MRFTVEERQFVVQKFYEVNKNKSRVTLEFDLKFRKTAPSFDAIAKMVKKFETRGTVHDQNKGRSGRPITVSTPQNIEKIRDFFEANPRGTIKTASQHENISQKTVHRILKKKLSMHPYKIQNVQLLSQPAIRNRLESAHIMLDLVNDEQQPDILNDIWFSDEAHFYLTGYCNKQNQRMWSTENPHSLNESPLFPKRITIWAALSSKGVHFQVLHQNVNSFSLNKFE